MHALAGRFRLQQTGELNAVARRDDGLLVGLLPWRARG